MHRGRRNGVALGLLAGALFLAAAPARAQQPSAASAADKATAEVLFHEGTKLLAQNKLAEACPKLAESLRLDTGIGTMLYLAECWERSGRTASAWAQFREAQAVAGRLKDPREKVARSRADQLEPRLARLTVVVPQGSEAPELVVTRDGTALGRATWGIETPVDPGKHVLRAAAPGRVAWETTIDIVEAGARERIVLPPLAEERPAPAPESKAPAPAPAAPSRAEVDTKDASKLPTQRLVALGVAGVGVIGVGLGAFFGLRASSTIGDANALCDERFCTAEGLSLRDDAKTQANVSTVAFVAGGAALAGAAALWFTAPKPALRARARAQTAFVLVPRVSTTGVEIGASARF